MTKLLLKTIINEFAIVFSKFTSLVLLRYKPLKKSDDNQS